MKIDEETSAPDIVEEVTDPLGAPDSQEEPGKNSFAQLQDAGARATAAYQKQREQQRREMLEALNPVDAARARAERSNNNLLATKWSRQRPDPVPPQIPSKEVMAEAARYRRRKREET